MSIDWNIAVVETLREGKFPRRTEVKTRLQWIDNRLHVLLSSFHGYCYFSHKEVCNNSDLEDIESCLIEIIYAATTVLKIVRTLKTSRMISCADKNKRGKNNG